MQVLPRNNITQRFIPTNLKIAAEKGNKNCPIMPVKVLELVNLFILETHVESGFCACLWNTHPISKHTKYQFIIHTLIVWDLF